MNDLWRRRVENNAVGEIAVFGDDRQIVSQSVVPDLCIRPFIADIRLMNVVFTFQSEKRKAG